MKKYMKNIKIAKKQSDHHGCLKVDYDGNVDNKFQPCILNRT